MRRNIDYCLSTGGSLHYTRDQLHQLRMARQAVESFHQIRAAISESNEEFFVRPYQIVQHGHADIIAQQPPKLPGIF